MAGTNSNYSIVLDTVLDLEKIQRNLNSRKYSVDVETTVNGKGIKETTSATQSLDGSTKELSITYQQLRQVFDAVVDVTSKMYTQVKTLDTAQTEFKKVSDLTGAALDSYTQKLANMGKEVGRTGKPNRSEPVCCDGKVA